MIPVVQSEQTTTAPTFFHAKKAATGSSDLFGKIMSQMSVSLRTPGAEMADAPSDVMLSTATVPQALAGAGAVDQAPRPDTDTAEMPEILGLLEQQASQVQTAAPEGAELVPADIPQAADPAAPRPDAMPEDMIAEQAETDADPVLLAETPLDASPEGALDAMPAKAPETGISDLDTARSDNPAAAVSPALDDAPTSTTDAPDRIDTTAADTAVVADDDNPAESAAPEGALTEIATQAPQPVAAPVQAPQAVQTAQIAAQQTIGVQTTRQPVTAQAKDPVANAGTEPTAERSDSTKASGFEAELTKAKSETDIAVSDRRSPRPNDKFSPTLAKTEVEAPVVAADKAAPIRQGDGQPTLPGSTAPSEQVDQSGSALQLDGTTDQPAVDMTADNWEDTIATQIDALFTENGGEIDIALTPDNLGSVRIRLELNDGAAQVTIVTETDQAARLFAQSEQKLSEMLAKSGMNLTGQEAGTERRQDQGTGRNASGQSGQNSPNGTDDRADVETRAAPVKGLVNLIA